MQNHSPTNMAPTFIENVAALIDQRLNGEYCVASVGSNSSSESDILIARADFSDRVDVFAMESVIHLVGELIRGLRPSRRLITSHHHDLLALTEDSPKLHLLLYPSISFMEAWEAPSFLAYVHDRGSFYRGNSGLFGEYARRHRARHNGPHSQVRQQLFRYCNIAFIYWIHLILGSPGISMANLFGKLCYAVRFTLIEIYTQTISPESPITFWDWAELFRLGGRDEREGVQIMSTIERYRNIQAPPSKDDLLLLYQRYFELFNSHIKQHVEI